MLYCGFRLSGEVREWLNRHDWKSCEPSGSEGSNPSLSAIRLPRSGGEVPEWLNGAVDPRAGAVISTARLLQGHPYRHAVEVVGGVLAEDCGRLLRDFFQQQRQ